ncbi:MAG: class I SAM-dependent methyltransferase [Candidatus Omnitrophica bacterium]|nr:class I SAM-dependent methyltransferase [Candidatus Omnitrophota bacterium]
MCPAGGPIQGNYFQGWNYFDYETQALGDALFISQWIRDWTAPCKILEIGCGSGLALKRLEEMGFESYGVDIADWAVHEAKKKMGSERIHLCDIEKEPLPFQAPFDAIFLSAVFEHFHKPYEVIKKLLPLTRKGTLIFIRTANPKSLTRQLFKQNWEGYFDYSHYGIEQVFPSELRKQFSDLGWKIMSLDTDSIWTCNGDEVAAAFRDFYSGDARFRLFIKEFELGDFISLVARRTV